MSWTKFDTAAVNSLFFLGHSPGDPADPITYPKDPKQRPHLAYYGTTRSGKTFAIEYVLQQLAQDRAAGFCFIDPHASGYWRMASFLRQHEITNRVLFWDINDPDYVVTYDPFDVPNQSPAYIAGNLTSAILATLGQHADASDQPHLKTMTESGLRALLSLRLPFLLSHELFDPKETRIKKAVAERVGAGMLGAIAELPKLIDRYRELAAPYRRFENLFQDDRLKLTFAAAGVDFLKLMDDGYIVLVNTEPKDQADEAATLFTRLLVKSFFMAAKRRTKADETRPFFLVIDEASRYLTKDTAGILAQTAGYGLYLIAGMQGLEQAKLEDEASYLALRENVGGEVVMRLLDHEEKLYWARRFFGDHLDFKTVKHTTTVATPRTVDHVITASGRSTSTDKDGRTVTVESETDTPGQHVEYDYEDIPEFFTTEQLELLQARNFGLREEGKGQRLGMARVNERMPTRIEVPELDPAAYKADEMVDWLRTFKATQPATIPLIEAKERFDALVEKHVQLLTNDNNTPDHEPPPTRQPGRRASVVLKPATPKPKPAARPVGTKK